MRSRFKAGSGWGWALLCAVPLSACLIFAGLAQAEQMTEKLGVGVGGVREVPEFVEAMPAVKELPLAMNFPVVPAAALELMPAEPVSLKRIVEEAVAAQPLRAEETVSYGGKRFRYVKTLKLRVTAYAADPRCCWPYPGTTTASGKPVTTNGGKLVAADTSVIAMHSLVAVPGYAAGNQVPVLDRGGAIKGHRLDVLLPSYEAAVKWGVKMLDVKVYSPVK